MSVATTMPVMIAQVIAMFLMMVVGAALYRGAFVDNTGSTQLSNVALYVATPAVILQALAISFDAEKLVAGAACFVLSFAFTVLSAAVARLFFRDRRRAAQLGITISNMGFMGIPIVQSVLGEECVFYISACMAGQVPLIWSYGVWLISQDASKVSPKKIATNPSVIAVVIGIILFCCSINLSGVIKVTAQDLGNLNTGLAMLVMGTYLAQTDLRSLVRDRNLYAACALRLLVVPAIVMAVLAPLPLDAVVKLVVLIALSAPCGTVSAMFPQMFGGDYRFGAGLVSLSTLLSLIVMPALLAVGLVIF
ncbi:AEC family transporter [Collinsella tanakaei]|uniref:AEC family transporter n=1 Tax=Collinsella tanakaei TaxID=626935 RepID=UPI00195BDE3A|nr:AEC family transporter [Collinsella tanakaei]MBM6756063.1 AEC family transporter [Collinsella tanakaei]